MDIKLNFILRVNELKCEKCNYQTKRDDSLEEHYNFKHLGIRYTCDFCDYISANKNQLKAHMKRMHKNVVAR